MSSNILNKMFGINEISFTPKNYQVDRVYTEIEKKEVLFDYFYYSKQLDEFGQKSEELNEKKKKIIQYGGISIAIGLLVLIIFSWIFLGILGIVAGGILIFLITKIKDLPQPSKVPLKLIDRFIEEKIIDQQQRSLEMASLDPRELVREPIYVMGPYITENLLWRVGSDGKARFSEWESMLLNFTEKELVIYQGILNLREYKWMSEESSSYFLQDINTNSIKIVREPKRVKVGEIELVLSQRQIFSIGSMGSYAEITLSDPELVSSIKHYDPVTKRNVNDFNSLDDNTIIDMSKARDAIRTINQLVREKKK